MNLKKVFLFFKNKISIAIIPGVAFSAFALLYTVIFNVSLSYMGNSAANSLSFVLNNLLTYLIIVIVKVVVVYLILYSMLSLFFYFGLSGIFLYFKIKLSRRMNEVIVFGIIALFYVLQLFRGIINYPQMYMDSFYLKNRLYASLQEFLTNYISPYFFAIFQITIVMIFFIGIVYLLYKKFDFTAGKVFHSVKLRLIAGILIAAASAFLITDILLLNRTLPLQQNLIIIASDALRPDHFSGNGYYRDTTPGIDAFMKESLTASNINTVTPRTFPSWVSILTSQYPHSHSIRNMFPSSGNRNREFISIASLLRDRGYDTSVVGDFAADIFPRINLGFNKVITPTFNASVLMEQIILKSNIFILPFITNRAGMMIFHSLPDFAEFADPNFVIDEIKSQIDKSKRSGRPFFITSFFSITHFPFSSPWPYYSKYTDPEYTGPSKYMKNRIVSLGTGGNEFSTKPDVKDIAHVRALYDGCLRGFNDSFMEILEYLKRRGLSENTVVVLLSDHGENLYEFDNGMGHGEHLRGRWSLNVPFALKAKGVEPVKINQTRSLIDVAPTICDVMKIDCPESFEGSSLLKPCLRNFDAYIETGLWFDTSGDYFFQKKRIFYPDITGFSAIEFDYNGEVYVSHDYFNLTNIAKHRAIKKGDYKLIYMPTSQGIEYELYNTKKDPDERYNIISVEKVIAANMKKILFGFVAEDSGSVEINGYIVPLFNDPVF